MRYLPILTLLVLTSCGELSRPYCERKHDPVKCEMASVIDDDLFEMCLEKLVHMRSSSGGDYTANDDEDLDEAIRACDRAASPFRDYQKQCFPNPEFVQQQKYCEEKPSDQ